MRFRTAILFLKPCDFFRYMLHVKSAKIAHSSNLPLQSTVINKLQLDMDGRFWWICTSQWCVHTWNTVAQCGVLTIWRI